MSNNYSTRIECSDPKKQAETNARLLQLLKETSKTFSDNSYDKNDPLGEPLVITTKHGYPIDEIIRLSIEYNNLCFIVEVFCETAWEVENCYHFENGIGKFVEIRQNYLYPHFHSRWENDENVKTLQTQIFDFFKSIDVIREREQGGLYVDWVENPVTYTAENKEYKMVTTKVGCHIKEIKLFRITHTIKTETDYTPIDINEPQRDDLPF